MADAKSAVPAAQAVVKTPKVNITAIVHLGTLTAEFTVHYRPQTLGTFVACGVTHMLLVACTEKQIDVKNIGLERAGKMILSLDAAAILKAFDKQMSDFGVSGGDVVHITLQ
jgi:hypothetical protein